MEKATVGAVMKTCPGCGRQFATGATDNYRIPEHKCILTKEFKKKMEEILGPLLTKKSEKKKIEKTTFPKLKVGEFYVVIEPLVSECLYKKISAKNSINVLTGEKIPAMFDEFKLLVVKFDPKNLILESVEKNNQKTQTKKPVQTGF